LRDIDGSLRNGLPVFGTSTTSTVREREMKNFDTSIAGTIVAAIASIATTLTLLWAVVSLSEPQRSQLTAATAARQMVNQRAVALAKPGQTQTASQPVEAR